MRKEHDFLGEMELPADALYGIHSERARQNFPDSTPFHLDWLKAIGMVKHACYQTVLVYIHAVTERYGSARLPSYLTDVHVYDLFCEAAFELSTGKYAEHFIVPAIQGGAGTSINMNVNEILANAVLIKLGRQPGDYDYIDPMVHANVFQSTNDVVPTALKVAAMQRLTKLEHAINGLRASVERLESSSRQVLRMAYTQMQEAVPSSFGMLFSTYSEALSRDWWRVSKCFERIKVVNLGGGATGTGLAIPRYYIMEVIPHLQRLSGLPVTRSENLPDTTQNLDSYVEVHAILKALAVNLEKMSADIRLLASDVRGKGELRIPSKQTGSSIMPGKVNPVVPEYVISVSHKVYSNDMLVSNLSAQGVLDLNPYLPVIGHAILDSLHLLEGAVDSLHHHVFNGLQLEPEISKEEVFRSPAITTAILPLIGYRKATEMALLMREEHLTVFEVNAKLGYLTEDKLADVLKPEQLLQLGYSLKDMSQ